MRLPFRSSHLLPRIRAPPGHRIYAIGDVHGRLDLLVRLIGKIAADDESRSRADTQIILLGDTIDRGPYSAECIEYLLRAHLGFASLTCLLGNHEAIFLQVVRGELDLHESGWLSFGGAETLVSYGFPRFAEDLSGPEFQALASEVIPREHIDFVASFQLYVSAGDYLFVHAGIRPGCPIEQQDPRDLLWIRGKFLNSSRQHERLIVHGHTSVDQVEFHSNRIAIDTGACRTGRLTALGIEGEDRWLLQT